MQVMIMRLMFKTEYLIAPKGTKFTGLGRLRLCDTGSELSQLRSDYTCTSLCI